MELIDKSTLVTEIKRRISNHNKELKHASDEDFVSSWASDEENQKLALIALIPFINTLEVKEVDLDFQTFAKEMETVFALPSSKTENTEEEPLNWEYVIAKHFYELGLKTKKGE